MTVFNPCFGCLARNDCDIKRSVIKALKGVPITKATIKCDLPFTRDFPPGTRVMTTVYDPDVGGYSHAMDDVGINATRAPATVIKPSTGKRGKLLLHLDKPINGAGKGNNPLEYSTAYPKDLTKLDEPLRVLCETCHVPMADGECCKNKDCWGDRS